MSRWSAAIARIRSPRPARRPLTVGERYICDLDGRGEQLVDLEFVASEDWAAGSDDGGVCHGCTAVLRGRQGQRIEIPRGRVLWHHDEHQSILIAARSLGIDLIPSRRRPVPVWRVGTARIGVSGMVELGRLLTVNR